MSVKRKRYGSIIHHGVINIAYGEGTDHETDVMIITIIIVIIKVSLRVRMRVGHHIYKARSLL